MLVGSSYRGGVGIRLDLRLAISESSSAPTGSSVIVSSVEGGMVDSLKVCSYNVSRCCRRDEWHASMLPGASSRAK